MGLPKSNLRTKLLPQTTTKANHRPLMSRAEISVKQTQNNSNLGPLAGFSMRELYLVSGSGKSDTLLLSRVEFTPLDQKTSRKPDVRAGACVCAHTGALTQIQGFRQVQYQMLVVVENIKEISKFS